MLCYHGKLENCKDVGIVQPYVCFKSLTKTFIDSKNPLHSALQSACKFMPPSSITLSTHIIYFEVGLEMRERIHLLVPCHLFSWCVYLLSLGIMILGIYVILYLQTLKERVL